MNDVSFRWIRKAAWVAFLAVVAPLSVAAQPVINDCSDPYWANTLRCAAFPGAVPQPPPQPPFLAVDIKDFTRVDLNDWQVRCLDGTRPIVYVDRAVGPPSDQWLITLTGGGACNATDSDGNGTFDDAQRCVDGYFGGEAGEMSTASKPIMKNLGNSGPTEGINKPDPLINPVFAGFNRIRIEKCGFDRHNGRSSHPGVSGTNPMGGGSFSFTLFSHGRDIVERALDELRGNAGVGTGLSYTTWISIDGEVVQITETLPPLESADLILMVGHSGGSHGLMHMVDGLAETIDGWPAFSGEVRAVFDASFTPALENEVAFDPGNPGDIYDHVWSGTSLEVGLYDGLDHYSNSSYAEQYDSWFPAPGAPLDSLLDHSCVAVHEPLGDAWKCRDRYHVLFNHLTTPFFVREDWSDSNRGHYWNDFGHPVTWADWGSFPHCAAWGSDPCPPLLGEGNPTPYRQRITEQYTKLAADHATRSELALGDDTSGPPPTKFFWMPDCGSHVGSYDDDQFFRVRISDGATALTMREVLESFAIAPPVGLAVTEIDGLGGRFSICRSSAIFTDGFESGDVAAWSTAEP